MASPYQPSLLRLLHGLVMLVVGGSWLSGLVVHGVHDGRLLRLPPDFPGEWVDIHGSLGVVLVLLFTVFAPYALSVGRARLRRPANAVALLALALAIGSGLLMSEEQVRLGQLDTLAYRLHLSAWGLLSLAVLAHLIGVLRRGGPAFALSMLSPALRPGDRPADWPEQLRRHFRR